MLATPVFTTTGLSVYFAGFQPYYSTTRDAITALKRHCAIELRNVCLVLCARNQADLGHKTFPRPDYDKPVRGDGTVLTKARSAAILQTADCPTLILHDTASNQVVVAHAGRPALTPDFDCETCTANIIDHAISELPRDHDPTQVKAYVTAGISGKHFLHNEEGGEDFIKPFDRFGPDVFYDRSLGALDMLAVIKQKLCHFGLSEAQIFHDGLCTKTNPALSSRRGKKHGHNSIFVVRH